MGQIPMKARTKVHNLGPFSELDIAPSFIYWYFSSLQLWSLEITGTLFYINWHFFPGIPVPQYKIVGNCLLRQKWAIILNKLDSLVVYISDCQSGGPSSNLCWDFFLFFPFLFFSPLYHSTRLYNSFSISSWALQVVRSRTVSYSPFFQFEKRFPWKVPGHLGLYVSSVLWILLFLAGSHQVLHVRRSTTFRVSTVVGTSRSLPGNHVKG